METTIMNLDWTNKDTARQSLLDFVSKTTDIVNSCINNDMAWSLVWWTVSKMQGGMDVTVEAVEAEQANLSPATDAEGDAMCEAINPLQIIEFATMIYNIIQLFSKKKS